MSDKIEIVSRDEVFGAVQQVSDALQVLVETERRQNGAEAAERLESLQLVALGALFKLRREVQDGKVAESLDQAVEYVARSLAAADVVAVVSNVPPGNA